MLCFSENGKIPRHGKDKQRFVMITVYSRLTVAGMILWTTLAATGMVWILDRLSRAYGGGYNRMLIIPRRHFLSAQG